MAAGNVITQADYIEHHLTNWTSGGSGFWSIDLDTLSVSIVLGIIFLLLFALLARCATRTPGVPGRWQNFVEFCVEAVDKTVRQSSQHADTRLIAPMALTIFVWVFLMNFMDLIPIDLFPWVFKYVGIQHFRPVPTANPSLTFAMSIVVFILIIFYNLKCKGLLGLTKEMLSKPFGWYLMPINVAFRLIEEFVKPISLSLRLFGNLFAGEIVFILIAMLPWYLQLSLGMIWTLFHVLVISIQAFIFMMLTIIYLSMAQETH